MTTPLSKHREEPQCGSSLGVLGDGEPSRLPQKLDYRSYLCSGEHLGFLLIPLGHHGLPHTARLVHLLTEEAHLAPKQKFNKVKFFSDFIFQTIMHSRLSQEKSQPL